MFVPAEWIEAFLEWVQNNHESLEVPLDNLDKIKEIVLQQWIDSNILDIQFTYISDDMIRSKSFVFKGVISLQVSDSFSIM